MHFFVCGEAETMELPKMLLMLIVMTIFNFKFFSR